MFGSARTASRSSHSSVVRRTISTARSSSPGCGSPRLFRAGMVTQPDVAQRLEHVGEVLAQLDDEAGEEAVGLVDLLGAAAVGVERLLDVSGRGERIAFEQDHAVSGPSQCQRRAEPADARADHDDAAGRAPARHRSIPVTASAMAPPPLPLFGNGRCQRSTIRYGESP